MRRGLSLLMLSAVAVSVLLGCGGGGDSTSGGGGSTAGGADRVLASVAISDGNNQTATVGTDLVEPLVALLLNQSGSPIAELVVNFRVVMGGGSVFAGAAISDNNGFVRERWTLGTVAGPQKVEVRAVDSSGAAVVFATFDAVAAAGAPTSVGIASGNSQSAIQLQPLPLPVKVVVSDAYGNLTPGVAVAFTASNEGTAIPGTVMTNAAGVAAASWTLGLAIGGQTLDAVVTGLLPVRFNATATQAPPSEADAINKFSGDLQSVWQHFNPPQPLQVLVTDVLENGVPGAQVIFAEAVGSGYLTPTTVTTDSAGKAGWSGYFHTTGEKSIVASVAGLPPVNFTLYVTPNEHQYDGLYITSVGGKVFSVVNGVGYGGIFNEADGTIFFITGMNLSTHYTGQIVIDSLQNATCTGTWSRTWAEPTSGTWTCERL